MTGATRGAKERSGRERTEYQRRQKSMRAAKSFDRHFIQPDLVSHSLFVLLALDPVRLSYFEFLQFLICECHRLGRDFHFALRGGEGLDKVAPAIDGHPGETGICEGDVVTAARRVLLTQHGDIKGGDVGLDPRSGGFLLRKNAPLLLQFELTKPDERRQPLHDWTPPEARISAS